MRRVYDDLAESLSKGESSVLASIIEEKGSSPRGVGAKMLVHPDLSISETIGGGWLEAETIHACRDVFASHLSRICHFDLTAKDAAGSDMICGGYGRVLLQYIDPENIQIKKILEQMKAAYDDGQKGTLLTRWEENSAGALDVSVSFHVPSLSGMSPSNSLSELISPRKIVYIFGAGHVALALSKIADFVDFHCIVLDNRPEFASAERFPRAEIRQIKSYAALPDLSVDAESFVVIVTSGHLGDYDVLEQMLRTDAGYIGMIGSHHKRDAIYQKLRAAGFGEDQIARVHSPIGLPIKAETPEEIAVSILAEMIAVRAGMKKE